MTTSTAEKGPNDNYDGDGVELVDGRPRRKPRQTTLHDVGSLDYCDEGRVKTITNSICQFLVGNPIGFSVV